MPSLDPEQISDWIHESAGAVAAPNGDIVSRPPTEMPSHSGFDLKKARLALQRARRKTELRTVKPLRRLRTDQAAVNEALIDAVAAMLSVNKLMATELSAVATELANLRTQVANRGAKKD